ncbi:unnamed protein product [Prunus armeniaca]|uniref:F-box protein n=1 Tax=Prunus armeniaca TaxID=36596 RepID=A0A6J5WWU4_PRUAR|nr:hypothetical protein GBA52_022188 [Prunus armeniaca]KAH0985912.1 hypothetical protein GBA52_013089 [Prunus armeniaca]CAB4306140.1 unnamed protein product [Prunus armeniaca]
MATFQVSSIFCLMGSPDQMRFPKGGAIKATTNNAPKFQVSPISLPKLPSRSLVDNLDITSNGYKIPSNNSANHSDDPMVTSKLYAIMEAIADRVEMHKNIGAQRDNWNHLLLMSINAITLAAATMAGTAAATFAVTTGARAPFMALKLSSTILYVAATGMLVVMNKIQPSQLAEEQRYAARLFKQLHAQIQTTLSLHSENTMVDVNEAMEKVLALDRAYPLPLLGEMLDKFPKTVEPTIWWPKQNHRRAQGAEGKLIDGNGWSKKLEEEMIEVVGVLKSKDVPEYLKLTEKALKINRVMAISGPTLTGLAALGSAFVGSSGTYGVWGVMAGVICGALASVVNTLEHGGQVGMVVEMYRSNAGFFRLMQETIESNVKEKQVERRENGQVFEMKVALQLGRSLSELKDLAVFSEKFASKLF